MSHIAEGNYPAGMFRFGCQAEPSDTGRKEVEERA